MDEDRINSILHMAESMRGKASRNMPQNQSSPTENLASVPQPQIVAPQGGSSIRDARNTPSAPESSRASLNSAPESSIDQNQSNFSRPTIRRPVGLRSIVVSKRQKGNPLLEHIRRVPYEFSDITPDYVTGATSCALFISLKYHKLHPEYIYNRMGKLGPDYDLRILLVQVDIDSPEDCIKELTKITMYRNFTIVTAWSAQQAANFLVQLKLNENTQPTAIQGQTKSEYQDQLVEVMSKTRGVNKTNAVGFIAKFGSFEKGVLECQDLESIPGWGTTKAERFQQTISKPFII